MPLYKIKYKKSIVKSKYLKKNLRNLRRLQKYYKKVSDSLTFDKKKYKIYEDY